MSFSSGTEKTHVSDPFSLLSYLFVYIHSIAIQDTSFCYSFPYLLLEYQMNHKLIIKTLNKIILHVPLLGCKNRFSNWLKGGQ